MANRDAKDLSLIVKYPEFSAPTTEIQSSLSEFGVVQLQHDEAHAAAKAKHDAEVAAVNAAKAKEAVQQQAMDDAQEKMDVFAKALGYDDYQANINFDELTFAMTPAEMDKWAEDKIRLMRVRYLSWAAFIKQMKSKYGKVSADDEEAIKAAMKAVNQKTATAESIAKLRSDLEQMVKSHATANTVTKTAESSQTATYTIAKEDPVMATAQEKADVAKRLETAKKNMGLVDNNEIQSAVAMISTKKGLQEFENNMMAKYAESASSDPFEGAMATKEDIYAGYLHINSLAAKHGWSEIPGGQKAFLQHFMSEPITKNDFADWVEAQQKKMEAESEPEPQLPPPPIPSPPPAVPMQAPPLPPLPITPIQIPPALAAKTVEASPPITDYELKVWQDQVVEHVETKRELNAKERARIKADIMKSFKAVQATGDRKALEKSIAFLKTFHASSKDTSNEDIAKSTETLLKEQPVTTLLKPKKKVAFAEQLITGPTAPKPKVAKPAASTTPILPPPTPVVSKPAVPKAPKAKKEPVTTLLKPKAAPKKATAVPAPKAAPKPKVTTLLKPKSEPKTTELQKARAKALNWWDKHPSGMNQDMSQKAKSVVTQASKYEPTRNDFKGVDDKKYSVVRWKR